MRAATPPCEGGEFRFPHDRYQSKCPAHELWDTSGARFFSTIEPWTILLAGATIRHFMALGIDTIIGPYRISSLLGQGGMGVVFRAHDTTLERDVAIKALSQAVAEDPTLVL